MTDTMTSQNIDLSSWNTSCVWIDALIVLSMKDGVFVNITLFTLVRVLQIYRWTRSLLFQVEIWR